MALFSLISKARLATCHPDLQRLFHEVVKRFDCRVLCGTRSQMKQDAAFAAGYSKVQWPNSKHNRSPSLAVDVLPYPVDWGDTNRMYHFAGYVRRTAEELGIPLRWGGDWDGDTEVDDQDFNDLAHFELAS